MVVVLDDAVLERAQRGERAALERFLERMYGPVHRMAYGLSGREDVGRGIVRFIIKQGLVRLPQWRDGEAAWRWFCHHTVLTSRRASLHPPGAKQDVLLRGEGKEEPSYVAFVRALRGLAQQQREAFILHHGEGLDLRHLAIAMDCSTHAAEMHLRAAHEVLERLAGETFAKEKERLVAAYRELGPNEEVIRPVVRRQVAKCLWPRRIKRVVRVILLLMVAGAVVWMWRWLGDVLPL